MKPENTTNNPEENQSPLLRVGAVSGHSAFCRPVNDCFKKSETIRAQHLLFEDFQQERKDIPKFIFYMWLNENQLQADFGKDHRGDAGYGLEFIPRSTEQGTCR